MSPENPSITPSFPQVISSVQDLLVLDRVNAMLISRTLVLLEVGVSACVSVNLVTCGISYAPIAWICLLFRTCLHLQSPE